MLLSSSPPTDGKTLQSLFALTQEELAAEINKDRVLAAAQDDQSKFHAWMDKTHWPHISDQLAGHVCTFFDVNLATIFAGAWSKYAELKKAAAETRDDPKTTASLALATHDFTYTLSPTIDVLLNGARTASIPFEIAVTFTVSALELALKQGAVFQISSGTCDCNGTLQCSGNTLWTRNITAINLPGVLRLTHPILLT
jgi:hypothetical protein